MSLFARRQKPGWTGRIKAALWPQRGFGRMAHYYRHRLTRLPGTSHSIATGIAAGIAMCFMPPGLHIGLAMGLALLLRGSTIAAALTTIIIGNPLVSGLLIGADIGLGELLVGHGRAAQVGADISVFEAFRYPSLVIEKFKSLGVAYMLGAVILSLLSYVIVYFLARRMVIAAHAARARRLRKRWKAQHG